MAGLMVGLWNFENSLTFADIEKNGGCVLGSWALCVIVGPWRLGGIKENQKWKKTLAAVLVKKAV